MAEVAVAGRSRLDPHPRPPDPHPRPQRVGHCGSGGRSGYGGVPRQRPPSTPVEFRLGHDSAGVHGRICGSATMACPAGGLLPRPAELRLGHGGTGVYDRICGSATTAAAAGVGAAAAVPSRGGATDARGLAAAALARCVGGVMVVWLTTVCLGAFQRRGGGVIGCDCAEALQQRHGGGAGGAGRLFSSW
uniref:Uncharacterized protein n=1 Tax=Setaria viridis TaxID=4556 RepID=A0A4U6U0N9_SETVI|nr:hypothetical protein SEVIR_7G050500v2 [Setaria viridis]